MAKDNKVQSVKKPANNLSRVTKQRKETKTDRMTKMVSMAFRNIVKKDGKGVTMAGIRKYIENTFSLEMTTGNKMMLKKVLGKAFRVGIVVMTNHNSSKIDYTKRFAIVDNDDDDSSSVENESNHSVETEE